MKAVKGSRPSRNFNNNLLTTSLREASGGDAPVVRRSQNQHLTKQGTQLTQRRLKTTGSQGDILMKTRVLVLLQSLLYTRCHINLEPCSTTDRRPPRPQAHYIRTHATIYRTPPTRDTTLLTDTTPAVQLLKQTNGDPSLCK